MTTDRILSNVMAGRSTQGRLRQHTLKHVVEIRGGMTPSKENPDYWQGEIPWVSPKDMKVEVISDSEDHISGEAVRATHIAFVSPPAVLMVIRGMILDHSVPVALTAAPVTLNQDMKALMPKQGLRADFLAWLLRAKRDLLLSLVEESGHGTKALRSDLWRAIPVEVPPLVEQKAIAAFLDRKTAAIDALIANKERQVELLQEKRQALLTQAVTKGLDPNVPMKDSGIEWLGKIPAHWAIHQLRRVVREFVDYRGRTPTKVDEGVPLITAGAVRDGRIDHERAPEYMAVAEYREFMRRGIPEVGDLVFTSEAPLGEVALVGDPTVAFAQRIILFRINKARMLSEFLWLYYRSDAGRGEVVSRSSGSTAEGIRADRLRGSLVPVPPLAEQHDIVEAVKQGLEHLGPIGKAVEVQIELLREYRQAIITAAVTGKIEIPAEEAA